MELNEAILRYLPEHRTVPNYPLFYGIYRIFVILVSRKKISSQESRKKKICEKNTVNPTVDLLELNSDLEATFSF